MKNLKKLLAFILSFAMILTMVQLPLVISAEDTTENVVTVYVSTLGSDAAYVDDATAYGDGTAEHPYLTIAKAEAAIEADTTATAGKIILVDTGTDATDTTAAVPASYTYSSSVHTKLITITAEDSATVLSFNNKYTQGPMKFDNLYLSGALYLRGNDLTYGENLNISGNTTIWTAGNAGYSSPDDQNIYVPKFLNQGGWTYCSFRIGQQASSDGFTVNGDTNLYIESVNAHQFLIDYGIYKGNVNIVVEQGYSGTSSKAYFLGFNKVPVIEGALQVVLNNGITRAKALNLSNLRTNAPCDYYFIEGAKATDGSYLTTTETAGIFKVNGNMVANAYKIDVTSETAEDGTVTYTETVGTTAIKSVNGILDLSDAPGEYSITYTEPVVEENDDTIVYVSETGKDYNDGQTPETAFGTIEFAEKWLNASTAEGDKTIEIIGTVQFYSTVAHEDMFIYKAHDSSAVLARNYNYYNKPDLYNVVTLKGPATFEGFNFTNADPKIHTSGHKFVYKSDADQMAVYVGNYGKDNNNNRENFTYDYQWEYWNNFTLNVGSPTSTATTVNGADIHLVKGELNKIAFGKNNTFTDDVNIVFDGIRRRGDNYGGLVEYQTGIVFEKALQLVFNNGQKEWFKDDANKTTLEGIKANGGTWIIYGETASDGTVLRTTDTAGKYTVEGNLVANAYKVVDGVEATTPIQSIDGVLDLSGTDNAGIYNVRYSTRTAIENSDSVVYVSETGSDLSSGKTLENAFGTLEFATKWLAKSSATDKKIIVSGAEFTFVPVEYDGMLTITSVDGSSIIKFSDTKLLSNLTFDDVVISGRMYSNGNKVEITKNATLKDATSGIIVGATSADINKQDEIIISAGGPNSWSGMLRIGAGKTVASNGLKVIFNGGNFNQFIFSGDWAQGGTHYGDVNIIFNANLSGGCGGKMLGDPSQQIFNGALQYIFNNNTNKDMISDAFRAIEAKDGAWFMYSAAGGTLDTTADEGVFAVSSDLTAKAVNITTGEVYFSVNGVLEVPAGEYNVGYIEDENLTKTYYVSENGSDDNDGLTEATAVKTLSKAVELSSNTAKIVILDTAVYDITSAYTKNITITGGTITGDVTLYGDLIIENTVIDAQSIDTNGNVLVIGNGVSFANGKPSVVTDEILLINSGDFANIKIEGSSVSKLYAYGATVESVVISTSSTEAIVKVNVEGNTDLSVDGQYKTAQIIFNKTTADVTTEAENSWIIGSESSGDSTVDFTDTEGKFTVTTETEKTPVAVSKDGETVYVADKFDNTYDTIDLDSTAATAHDAFINYRGGMPNVYKKLQNNEKLNVVYFGGSVTAGAGLDSDADREIYSWRAKIGSWLVNNFPNSNITNINKSAGESGTYLGTYRIPYIIAENPDLLIIEYSINDFYYSSSYEDAAARFETIVREVKEALPNCDIITVLVTEEQFYTSSSKGNLHTQAQAHDDVAAYYNIPSLKVGCALTSQVAYADWGTYFDDIVHPTAAGYQLYYNCIEEFFSNALLHTEYVDDYKFVMPPVKSTYLFDGGRTATGITEEMIAYSTEQGGTFTYGDQVGNNSELYGVAVSKNVGDTFYFRFYGTSAAIAVKHTGQSYFPTISIDGGEEFTPTVASLAHNPIKIAEGLDLGWHTVKVTSTYATNNIIGIYYSDSTANTLQGEGADETYKKATLTLDSGTYNVKYVTSINDLVAPEKDDFNFIGWVDTEGNIVTELVAGTKLIASYEEIGLPEEDKPFDISGDGVINGVDLIAVMKAILKSSTLEVYDVNNDGKSDIRDLVALKNKLAEIYPNGVPAVVGNSEELADAIGKYDTIELSGEVVLTETLNVTDDIKIIGGTISGAPLQVTNKDANIELDGVTFVNATAGEGSAMILRNYAGNLTVKNCTFEGFMWDAIQVVPVDDAVITISDNTFIAPETTDGAQRYIHIEAEKETGTNAQIVVTNNNFGAVENLSNSAIDIDYVDSYSQITVGGNTFADDAQTIVDGYHIYICLTGDASVYYDIAEAYNAFTSAEISALN